MKSRTYIRVLLYFILIPVVILVGIYIFHDRKYAFVTLAVAVCSCIPPFVGYEKRSSDTGRLVVLAVLTALAVIGRAAFAFLPGFKPITAIVILTGMYLGAESGFLCGAFSALLSNFLFGQGPWTPLQMFSWGMIGFFAGILANYLVRHKILLLYGAFSGILYSVLMDVWSVLWFEDAFSWKRYAAMFLVSLPSTVMYMVSNVVFLLLLAKPFGEKLSRIQKKYHL